MRGEYVPVRALPAATVVVVRPAPDGPEVLLLRRHAESGFAPGAWAFPGGRVDEADRDPALEVLMDGPRPSAWAARLGVPDAADALGFVAASIRETFEETGILLPRPPLDSVALDAARSALLQGDIDLAGAAEALGVRLAGDELTYIGHWVTPEPEPRRFDARFFLARVPASTECVPHRPEATEAGWLTPARALAAFHRAEIDLLPPTADTLRRLSRFASVEAVVDALRDRAVPRILPRMRMIPAGIVIEFDSPA